MSVFHSISSWLHLLVNVGVCAGRSSRSQSTQWDTGPCWQWCCGGHIRDPPLRGDLWDPACGSVPVTWWPHRGPCLIQGHWGTEEWLMSNCKESREPSSSLQPYLRLAWVKQRFRSVSKYLRHCLMARGFDSTFTTDTDPPSSPTIFIFSSSLTKYTPDSSFPWVPPHTATRDNLGMRTTSSNSIWLGAGRDQQNWFMYFSCFWIDVSVLPKWVMIQFSKHPLTPSVTDGKAELKSCKIPRSVGQKLSVTDVTATQSRDIDLCNLTLVFWELRGSSVFELNPGKDQSLAVWEEEIVKWRQKSVNEKIRHHSSHPIYPACCLPLPDVSASHAVSPIQHSHPSLCASGRLDAVTQTLIVSTTLLSTALYF